ncbi:MAG: hypothetical protein WC455_30025 [Dehalococcoidia bacterium]
MPEEKKCCLCGITVEHGSALVATGYATGNTYHMDCINAFADNPCVFCANWPPPGNGACCECKNGGHFTRKGSVNEIPEEATKE